jgi:hypothetical protein
MALVLALRLVEVPSEVPVDERSRTDGDRVHDLSLTDPAGR